MVRRSWLDDDAQTTLIDNYAKQLSSFVEAMADGRVDEHELTAQEKHLVDLMKKVEPKLDDQLHDSHVTSCMWVVERSLTTRDGASSARGPC